MHRESLTIPLPEATLTQMVRDLVRSSLNTEDQLNHISERITEMSEQITELRTAIASEVAEAITQAEARIAVGGSIGDGPPTRVVASLFRGLDSSPGLTHVNTMSRGGDFYGTRVD